jgi:glyoxylase-like metal-dependent hydrolase (beta-lactamase superfamily II)
VIGVSEPAPGLRLITLPLPFELEHVNVGLVELGEGYLLIDTGMTFAALSPALEQAGVPWREIRTVFATHIHPDHIGSAPLAIEASGAELLMHRAEYEYLNRILEGNTHWIELAFTEGGVPPGCWDAIRNAVGTMRNSLGAIHPDRFVEDGEAIPTALGPAVVVATPGHSPGHLCLYWPDRRLLYSGDHMIETITPNIAWMPGRDMLGEYLESLDRVAALDVELVIASHGRPFGNHRAWIAATRRHHEERCSAILNHLQSGPRTAYELVPVLWDRDFSSFHLYFALFEVLAHLEHMHRRGIIEFEAPSAGARRWYAANPPKPD